MLGFVVGIARLSSNWLIARLAGVYVEIVRNVPLLLQLFFWYFAVLKACRRRGRATRCRGGIFLNVRGLYLPAPMPQPGFSRVVAGLLVGIVASRSPSTFGRAAGSARPASGSRCSGCRWPIVVGMPLVAFARLRRAAQLRIPRARGFNFQGGMVISPSSWRSLLGLSIYTASFIAEIVRAGIQGVRKGQKEAAAAIGLTHGQTLRLVIMPQAMRIIIPPLTSQYLNLTKNSSLAVAIGYPDLVCVFSGTVLNQTGQAIEVILMTMVRVPDHQPAHVDLHELVQPPHGAGGAMSAMTAADDASRSAAGLQTRARSRWLRANLFSSSATRC